MPELDISLDNIENYIAEKEAAINNIKPDNQSQIIWADSVRKTAYSIVYLHGWSASQGEADPFHEELAKRYGANLYLPRLAGHGIDDDFSFKDLTPNELWQSAQEALLIGNLIGEKTILLSCSTGGTLSVFLAANYPDQVHAQLLFSPNIAIYDNSTALLTMPWGKQLARQIIGDQHSFNAPSGADQYWTTTYAMEGLICLKSLVETTMTPETWEKNKQPLFMGYYYKNEENQDKTVSVAAMKEYYKNISTPDALKKEKAFPDAGVHVVLSSFHSKDLSTVKNETFDFLENILKLKQISRTALPSSAFSD
ncbi:MAG: alpha/beta hydrolase [Bacteroidota bacterium]